MISEFKNNCLIGSSGLIGQNLQKNHNFKHLINSRNIESILNLDLDLIICAAPSAVKWKINIDDSDDLKNIDQITKILSNVKCKKIILCSTVDVYGYEISGGFNESIEPDRNSNHNYGRNRILLEDNLRQIFNEKLCIVRLSGLFGDFLKKNMLFDIKTDNKNMLSNINLDSSFQWYNLKNLYDDLLTNIDKNIIHLVNEPIFNYELFEYLNINILNSKDSKKTNYNIKTCYLNDGYFYSKDEIKYQIKNYLTT